MAKVTKKSAGKTTKTNKNTKFSFINTLHESVLKLATVARNGEIRMKRTDLKKAIEDTFLSGVKAAAKGERVRFPVIGAIGRKEVKARKAGKGVNPFTGEEMMIKARPASQKPRWSFPKTLKETFANKKNW
ncbi:MAG: HU family DNA-binding protein [Methylotenera sp.]|nr:HU family DNA-binding protein [Oligoflexia bacterium]